MRKRRKGETQASPLKRALAAIEGLQLRLDASEEAKREPIAVVGMACRFPGGADDPRRFWELLREGFDAITEVPPDRWDVDAYYDPDPDAPGKAYARHGAFLPNIDEFDARLFEITPREAAAMDPQQRLLLEVGWEALEDAGIRPDGLEGSRTGVFVGIVNNDYSQLSLEAGSDQLGPYYASGVAHSIASGRLSYVLGLKGPCASIDTACSSSLLAVHLACQSLRRGESSLAMAAGVNVILVPETSIALSKFRMLAVDGRCKTFDARADGYVRGEGCGVVVLRRLSDAQAAGDRVLAVVRGSAVNQDGASSGLTAPNGPSQEDVLRRALADGRVAPGDVTYVETHGTGTPLGDPIEVQALSAVLGGDRPPQRPILLGSVKTNIGHVESAAGIAGLIKVVLAINGGEIPAHLHLLEPNPLIPWDRLPVSVPTDTVPWPEDAPRIAGVSSFGFSGTNVHVVVAGAPPLDPDRPKNEASLERPTHLLALSALDEASLRESIARVADRLEEDLSVSLPDAAFTAHVGRAALPQRTVIRAATRGEALDRLHAASAGNQVSGVVSGRIPRGDRPRLAFLFTGQGAQYPGMGRTLFETQPVFREAVERCDAGLRDHMDIPLLSLLYGETAGRPGLLDETAYTQI